MTTATPRPVRLAPLPPDARTPEQDALLLKATKTPREVNIYSTFVRNPHVYERWLGLAHGLLFDGALPDRVRELLILRTAIRCGCEYEWAQHRKIAARAGVEEREIAAVAEFAEAEWPPAEAVVLRAADELHDTATVSDGTWDELTAHYPAETVMEIVAVAGTYRLTAMMLNAFGVALDPGLVGFPR
ncbi:carboxymuconolactone decarboxylase family protein [Amycolatopsis jejuensis]|uniref:carboxymuconolactone decarboxylase family protein n=1 Tax=Amycolatopsis jejuensis TaxID=330084 RepID=UPI00068BF7BD|nr:carboxymuconolactone decarboxylase family protein [Amycolatopsis jejuensis]